jgi:uncharacterized protein (TIGR01777 family)
MNIVICGATGLVGSHLIKALEKRKETLTLVGRDIKKLQKLNAHSATLLTWDQLTETVIQEQDCLINLSGENVGAKKWSAKQKEIILQSRIHTTSLIANLCKNLGKDSPRIIQASAIGIYGSQNPDLNPELAAVEDHTALPSHKNFLSDVALAWEASLDAAVAAQVPVIVTRFGIILDAKEGALSKMLPSFRLGGGAILGDGKQAYSWVSIDDVIKALLFFIDHPNLTGAFNVVADEVVSQKTFAHTLAKTLQRPCFLTLPASMVQCLFQEMGKTLLLEGCNVSNQKI